MSTLKTPRSPSEPRARTGVLPLAAICLGYFMVILDATAVNLSLPALGRDLGGGMGVLQWVVDGYTLTFATLLLSAGALGDRLGPHRVFCTGLVLFVVASAACGLAPSAGVLVAARLVQGAGAAVMVPSSLALLQAAHPDPRARARAVGVWGGVAGIAAAFVAVERRATDPMLSLGLFRNPAFSGGNAVGLLINLGFYGQLFVVSLFFQDIRRMSPTTAGLALLPEGILVSLASFLSGRLTGRTGPRPTMLIGLCAGAAGLAALAAAGPRTPYLLIVVPLMAAGFGMAFTMPAATTTVVEAAPSGRAGVASGAINAARQVGSTVGVALLGTLGAAGGLTIPMVGAAAAFLAAALVVLPTARGHRGR